MSQSVGARIHVTGVVQGVGFRPFVYALAKRLELFGWVRNTSAGVDLEVDGELEAIKSFERALHEEAPPLAKIDCIEIEVIQPIGFSEFLIIHSQPLEGAFQPISPDVSICEDCRREMDDPEDRRYRYPFINCTNCGPRFTIIEDIPYDRPKTTMASFELCSHCSDEYHDPLDRRFHAQPVACSDCGPKVWLEMDGDVIAEAEDAIQEARRLLKKGKVIAIKGLGGFHLACDATSVEAVAELRRRKHRVDKAFAVMMVELETIEKHCFLDNRERELIGSHERPIVIVKRNPNSSIAREVAPGQDTLGVMLPYSPLHYLLLEVEQGFPESLVMTSGNFSEEPIATSNEDARGRLAPLADAFLLHDRGIRIRCDDSVVRAFEQSVYPLRRSRGYAPYPVHLHREAIPLIGVGGELKNTFCLTRGRYAFLSQHIGDMENYETLASFEDGVEHLENLFRIKPEAVIYDLHPNYMSTRYALERAEREGLPAVGVQHHHAHIAACMAENGLDGKDPVIGVSFDGTGYGDDGAIWGGEVLVCDYSGYERKYHLSYIPLPGGDKAVREPWRVALAWLDRMGIEPATIPSFLQARTPEEIKVVLQQIEKGINTPLTSSMGRLFDVAATLCGIRYTVNYEAQAAIEFEALVDPAVTEAYSFGIEEHVIDPVPALRGLIQDVQKRVPVGKIAACFHNGLIKVILDVCRDIRSKTGIRDVALSGGVWQNMVMLKQAVDDLQTEGFSVFLHREVPANDGGIALGQAVVGMHFLDPQGA
jgi:hydrogenase maturation protein HypF